MTSMNSLEVGLDLYPENWTALYAAIARQAFEDTLSASPTMAADAFGFLHEAFGYPTLDIAKKTASDALIYNWKYPWSLKRDIKICEHKNSVPEDMRAEVLFELANAYLYDTMAWWEFPS